MDSSKYAIKKLFSWIILIGSMLLSALSWFLELSPYLPSTNWRWYAVIFSVIFFATSIYRISNLENILSSKTPRITIHEPPWVTDIDDATKKNVYSTQTDKAKTNGTSNCPLCAIGHDANKSKIWKLSEMDADHVTAWSMGGATNSKNCQMLCKTHNRAKGNR